MKKIFSFFAAILLAGSMMADNLYSIDFKATQGDWEIDNVELGSLDYVWQQDAKYGMKASAFKDNTNNATESWLISPAIDLSSVQTAKLFISHARKFGELAQLSVKAKAGEGDWANLEISAWPDGSSWDFIDADADLAAYVGKAEVRIAFVYTSSTEAAATWEIASVTVTDGGEIVPPVLEVINVASALEIGGKLAQDTQTEDKYLIEGYVTQIDDDSFDTNYKNMTFWIADAQGTAATNADGAFEVYRGKPDVKLAVGDKIRVETAVKNFKGTIESETGAKVTKITESGVENIVLTEKAQKVMVDGVVYVVRDNKLFNVQGTQIR